MSYIVTAEELSAATGARIDRAAARVSSYNQMFAAYDITTRLRAACALANVGHETLGFKYATEVWGPTQAQLRYEGRVDLGNTQPGDGSLFRGHGDFQCTGRANHAAMRDRLRARFPHLDVPDFEVEPHKLAELPWAVFTVGEYIAMRGLHRFADAANFDGYCDVINRGRATLEPGDTNGFEHRLALFVAAMRRLP